METRHPNWLKIRANPYTDDTFVDTVLKKNNVNTVCKEACCPNIWECFQERTATFMIMGNHCTRNCSFCAVDNQPVEAIDDSEPERIALSAKELDLSYVVITSVTRDDLDDGGASMFALTIRMLKDYLPDACIEVLIPDFQGDKQGLKTVLEAGPDVLNHNIETVPRLYSSVRPQACYERSLNILERAKKYEPDVLTKSGLMLGLGETESELLEVGRDLARVGCSFVTIGQYLQPTLKHYPVIKYYKPEEFEQIRMNYQHLNLLNVVAGPLVRSSYRASVIYKSGRDFCARK